MGGIAIASDSGACDHVSPGATWLTGPTELPWLSARDKTRNVDNGGCEAVTNQASFTTGPLAQVGRGWL